jgi:hypothetical protein
MRKELTGLPKDGQPPLAATSVTTHIDSKIKAIHHGLMNLPVPDLSGYEAKSPGRLGRVLAPRKSSEVA